MNTYFKYYSNGTDHMIEITTQFNATTTAGDIFCGACYTFTDNGNILNALSNDRANYRFTIINDSVTPSSFVRIPQYIKIKQATSVMLSHTIQFI